MEETYRVMINKGGRHIGPHHFAGLTLIEVDSEGLCLENTGPERRLKSLGRNSFHLVANYISIVKL